MTVKRIRIDRRGARRESPWLEDPPADPRDPDVVRAKALGQVGSALGVMSVIMLLARTGPGISRDITLLQLPGYMSTCAEQGSVSGKHFRVAIFHFRVFLNEARTGLLAMTCTALSARRPSHR
jgi:hypothetical protein